MLPQFEIKKNSSDLFATYIFYLGKLDGQEDFLAILSPYGEYIYIMFNFKAKLSSNAWVVPLLSLKQNMLF